MFKKDITKFYPAL